MLGIYSATPPTRMLFHGTVNEFKGTHVLAKMPSCALVDTRTPVVCAGISYLHAAAYGFKSNNYSSLISGQYETPIVFIGTGIQGFLEKLLAQNTYIAELPAEDFKEGLFAREPQNGELPLEWYSRNDTKILQVKCLNNNEVLKLGVQLFIIADKEPFLTSLTIKDPIERARFCMKSGGEWTNQRYGLGAASWLADHLSPSRPTKKEDKLFTSTSEVVSDYALK